MCLLSEKSIFDANYFSKRIFLFEIERKLLRHASDYNWAALIFEIRMPPQKLNEYVTDGEQ